MDNVIDLNSRRKVKSLTVNSAVGTITGESEKDYGDRLSRIKVSLDKINRLMGELKKVSNEPMANGSINPVTKHIQPCRCGVCQATRQ